MDPRSQLYNALEGNPSAGPRPITLEEYRRRTAKKDPNAVPNPATEVSRLPGPPEKSKRHRSGHQVRVRRQLGELHRLAALSSGDSKRKFLEEVRRIKIAEYARRQERRRERLEKKTRIEARERDAIK